MTPLVIRMPLKQARSGEHRARLLVTRVQLKEVDRTHRS